MSTDPERSMEDEGGPALDEETEYDPDLSYYVDDYELTPGDWEFWGLTPDEEDEDAKASQARGEALDADPESSDASEKDE